MPTFATSFNPISKVAIKLHSLEMKNRSFADKLRMAIDADPDLTEAGLATKAGLANSTIRKLLAGTVQNPRVDTAMKICGALGTSIEAFMGSPQTEEEHDIVRLISQLSVQERRELVGFGKGMLAAQGQSRPKSGEGEQ